MTRMGTALSVNLNKVALLRNARNADVPSVLKAARIAVCAGADGITVHPRPDQRHIRPGDVLVLAETLEIELNIEGNPFHGPLGDYPGFLQLVEQARPAQCTLVPDSTEQLTSDHGWNLATDGERLRPIIDRLRRQGCRVSLFVDPDAETVARPRALGADRVELYTEAYARAHARGAAATALARYREAALAAQSAGLGVNAGHDLNLSNLEDFCRIVPGILEVSIGQALIADALELGLAESVRRYRECLARAEAARRATETSSGAHPKAR
jgi:pyridoxine 5-phosphate synthase